MSKSKPQSFESVRREIARRLKAGLPLAGMIAATTLLCGCSERPPRGPIGKMTTKNDSRCEQKSEQPKPTPPAPKKNGKNESREYMPAGALIPPEDQNQKNETKRPITPGRTRRETHGK